MRKSKFGHINIDDVFDLLPEKDMVKDQFADFARSMESQLIDLHKELGKKEEEISSLGSSRNKKKKSQAENEYSSLKDRIYVFQQNAITLLKEKEASLWEPFFSKIKDAIKIVGEEKGLLYVFDSNSLLFNSKDSIDITPDVISILKLTDNSKKDEFLN